MQSGPDDGNTQGLSSRIGPDPSFIQVARPYIFEQKLQECMAAVGHNEIKEVTNRLQGVAWIDSVRRALQLPVRTYNTAVVYYHKFRLVRPDDYDYREAAAAALFNACKIEDTLKKSRDILCAAHNLKLPPAEHLSPDDTFFESSSRAILGVERLMLEASAFDFRNRYPQKLLLKCVKTCKLDKETVGRLAYRLMLDLYRTYAPLKQTSQTMALSCLELAARLSEVDLSSINSEYGFDYTRWSTSREEIMETLVDMLDLYTHNRTSTIVGPEYPLDTFIAIRITLNQEASANSYPRYTQWTDHVPKNGAETSSKASPHEDKKQNGYSSLTSPDLRTPQSPSRGTGVINERGKEGTVRFMLDPGRARHEKHIVKDFFRSEEVEEEVFEIEVEVRSPQKSPPTVSQATPQQQSQNPRRRQQQRIYPMEQDDRARQREDNQAKFLAPVSSSVYDIATTTAPRNNVNGRAQEQSAHMHQQSRNIMDIRRTKEGRTSQHARESVMPQGRTLHESPSTPPLHRNRIRPKVTSTAADINIVGLRKRHGSGE